MTFTPQFKGNLGRCAHLRHEPPHPVWLGLYRKGYLQGLPSGRVKADEIINVYKKRILLKFTRHNQLTIDVYICCAVVTDS